jgi:hypothetical protein
MIGGGEAYSPAGCADKLRAARMTVHAKRGTERDDSFLSNNLAGNVPRAAPQTPPRPASGAREARRIRGKFRNLNKGK